MVTKIRKWAGKFYAFFFYKKEEAATEIQHEEPKPTEPKPQEQVLPQRKLQSAEEVRAYLKQFREEQEYALKNKRKTARRALLRWFRNPPKVRSIYDIYFNFELYRYLSPFARRIYLSVLKRRFRTYAPQFANQVKKQKLTASAFFV